MLPVQSATALRETLLQQRGSSVKSTQGPAEGSSGEGVFGGMLHAAQQQINAVDLRGPAVGHRTAEWAGS